MPQTSLFKKFTHITMAIILTCSTINLSLSPLQSITVTAQSPLSTFEQRKTDIKAKQAEIDQQLKDVNVDFESTTNRKSTLAAERKAREEEVNKIKTSIEIIDVLSKKIQGQIEEYKKELQGLENTQAEIYNE